MKHPTKARARLGVSLMFFSNGALFSALLPRYPEIKDAFGLDNAQFGLLVIAFPLGAIAAASLGAPLVRRFGARTVVAVGSALLAAALAVAAFSPVVGLFAVAMVLAGLLDAVVDAAQNIQGVAVESWVGKSILNSLHALWSLGAATGGALGAWAAAIGMPLGTQMLINGAVWVAVAGLGSALSAVPVRAPVARLAEPEDLKHDGDSRTPAHTSPSSRVRIPGTAWRLLLPLILLAISGTVIEDVANNWAVLYLARETDAAPFIAGLGLSVVLGAQFVGRLLGDPLTDRFGRERVAGAGGVLIVVGVALVVVSPVYVPVLIGYALLGFGCATLVPAAFAAAGRVPGLREGTGIATLGWLMRLGFLVTSPAIGAVSEVAGLRVAFLIPLAGGVVAVAIAWHLSRPSLRSRQI